MEQPQPVRRAPYAPISAVHGFLSSIRNAKPPARVDVAYLKAHALARGNEWAFISALKFLGVVDRRGHPTAIFRKLQGSQETSRDALGNLVYAAYSPLFEAGGAHMSTAELRVWFAQNSSASQAANATRFFCEVCELASITLSLEAPASAVPSGQSEPRQAGSPSPTASDFSALFHKLPSYEAWKGTTEEYLQALDLFARLVGAGK
jgi:Family of unknown function (DUF5343)